MYLYLSLCFMLNKFLSSEFSEFNLNGENFL